MTQKKVRVIELTVKERAVLPSILPAQGDKLTQIMVRSLNEKVRFTESEIEELEMKSDASGIRWNQKKAADRLFSFEVSDGEALIMRDASKELDNQKRVNQDNLSLVEKIDLL